MPYTAASDWPGWVVGFCWLLEFISCCENKLGVPFITMQFITVLLARVYHMLLLLPPAFPTPHRQTPREGKEFCEHFAEIFTVMDPRDFTDVFSVQMDVLFNIMAGVPRTRVEVTGSKLPVGGFCRII
jgi:hypothetical protein